MKTVMGLLAAVTVALASGCAATPCDNYCDAQAECSGVDASTCKEAYNNSAGATQAVQDACQAAADLLDGCGEAS